MKHTISKLRCSLNIFFINLSSSTIFLLYPVRVFSAFALDLVSSLTTISAFPSAVIRASSLSDEEGPSSKTFTDREFWRAIKSTEMQLCMDAYLLRYLYRFYHFIAHINFKRPQEVALFQRKS